MLCEQLAANTAQLVKINGDDKDNKRAGVQGYLEAEVYSKENMKKAEEALKSLFSGSNKDAANLLVSLAL